MLSIDSRQYSAEPVRAYVIRRVSTPFVWVYPSRVFLRTHSPHHSNRDESLRHGNTDSLTLSTHQ